MRNYFDYFDMVYFINLPNRVDRYDNVMKMFSILNITKYKQIIPIIYQFSQYNLPVSCESCKSAHISCIEDAIKNNYDKICIFEDDICFNQKNTEIENNLDYHLNTCFDFLKNNKWDIFYFDNIIGANKQNNEMKDLYRDDKVKGVKKIIGKMFAHSYALSKSMFTDYVKLAKNNCLRNDYCLYKIKSDKKYMYSDGIFDQLLNNTSDHQW